MSDDRPTRPAKVTVMSDARRKQRAGAWRAGLIVGKKGPERGIANVLHVMSQHPDWDQVLAYDDFFERVTKQKAPPVRPQDGASEAGEWCEEDTTRTCAWFATEVGFEPSTSHVDQAVVAMARRNVVHPIRQYLRGLLWDGVPRLDSMLATYFGVRATPYTQEVGSRWMISAVARVMRPGCQADCMLVLESERQGTGKSTGFEAIFSAPWFADTGLHIGDKDSYQALRGKWGYEFGELASLKGRELERVKNFVSARVDNYRPSYGRKTRDFPRQVVFCGTTNETEYLIDPSGERRFWPVRCDAVVHVKGLRHDRDQLWAEAVARYDAGAAWHVDTPELRALCEAEQREREVVDPWVGVVARWLAHPNRRTDVEAHGVTTEEVMAGALAMDAEKMNRAGSTRVGHVLRKLRWEPSQLREMGERVRRYFPPSQPSRASAATGCDAATQEKQGETMLSQPSQPHTGSHVHTHTQSSAPCFEDVPVVTGQLDLTDEEGKGVQ